MVDGISRDILMNWKILFFPLLKDNTMNVIKKTSPFPYLTINKDSNC